MKFFWMFVIVLLTSIVHLCLSFPTGAPQAACQTVAPDATQHGAHPQVTGVPYVLNLTSFYDHATGEMVYTPDTVYNRKAQSCYKINRFLVLLSLYALCNYILQENCIIDLDHQEGVHELVLHTTS